jgi:hypothetical protein
MNEAGKRSLLTARFDAVLEWQRDFYGRDVSFALLLNN